MLWAICQSAQFAKMPSAISKLCTSSVQNSDINLTLTQIQTVTQPKPLLCSEFANCALTNCVQQLHGITTTDFTPKMHLFHRLQNTTQKNVLLPSCLSCCIASRRVLFSWPSCVTTRIGYSHDDLVHTVVVRIAFMSAKAILTTVVWYNTYALFSQWSNDSVASSTKYKCINIRPTM